MPFEFQDETQKTLEYFLENFVRTFGNWTPAEDLHRGDAPAQAAESEGSIYGESSKTVVGCIHGHPTKVIFGLIRELKAVIQTFAACKYQAMVVTKKPLDSYNFFKESLDRMSLPTGTSDSRFDHM